MIALGAGLVAARGRRLARRCRSRCCSARARCSPSRPRSRPRSSRRCSRRTAASRSPARSTRCVGGSSRSPSARSCCRRTRRRMVRDGRRAGARPSSPACSRTSPRRSRRATASGVQAALRRGRGDRRARARARRRARRRARDRPARPAAPAHAAARVDVYADAAAPDRPRGPQRARARARRPPRDRPRGERPARGRATRCATLAAAVRALGGGARRPAQADAVREPALRAAGQGDARARAHRQPVGLRHRRPDPLDGRRPAARHRDVLRGGGRRGARGGRARPRRRASGPDPARRAPRSGQPGWQTGHQYVVRPPIVAARQPRPAARAVPVARAAPGSRRPCARRRGGSPSGSPRAARGAAGRAPRRVSSPAARRGESRARQSVSSASRLPTPASARWSSSRALIGAVPRPTPRAERVAADLGRVRADVREVGLEQRAAEPALVAQREPAAVGERRARSGPSSRGAGGSSTSIRPAMPRCSPSTGPLVSTQRNLPRRCARSSVCADQRRRDLARRVRAADVGVAVVDGDDLAAERAVDLLARALGLGELGHEREGRAQLRAAVARRASMRSTTSGASTCSITMTAAPITPARSSSAERTIRSERVPSGTARW